MKRLKKRRVNVTLPEDLHQQVMDRQLNLSGLIGDLLGDHLANHTVTIHVDQETKRLYEQVIANTGYEDADLELPFRIVLELLLDTKIAELERLREDLGKIEPRDTDLYRSAAGNLNEITSRARKKKSS